MDTAEKRIARAEALDWAATPGVAEARSLLPALAADAKRAVRYERNLCSIAKVLTDAGVPLTVETAEGPTIDRIHERVAHLVDDAKRARDELAIEQALTEDCSRLVIDCLGATGVDVEALAYAPYDANALNAMRRGLPERIRDTVSQRDRAIERAEKAERERDASNEALQGVGAALCRVATENHAESLLRLIKERGDMLGYQYSAQRVIDLLRQYQAACARWTQSKDPRDEAEMARLRGQLAIVALPKGGE